MRTVRFSSLALRALQQMPAKEAERVNAKIWQYARDPSSLAANVIKMTGRASYRLRVGAWRVIFDDDGNVMDILRIGPRKDVYK